MKRTTISVSAEVREMIYKLGKMGDTPSDVINRIILEYDRAKKLSKKQKITNTTVKQLKQMKQVKQVKKVKQKTEKQDNADLTDIERSGV